MKKLDCFDKNALKQTAYHLISQGFSIIPVHGDDGTTNPKKPVISWKKYQKRHASSDEIDQWFNQDITAVGIVCGQISRLMVLDFDDDFTYRQFLKAFPQYRETFTVKTRRGYHLYFEVDQYISTFKFAGGDIKAEKSYVITAPSTVRAYQYHVIFSGARAHLAPNQVTELLNYFHISTDESQIQPTYIRSKQTLDLQRLYDNLAPQLGRNNALYRVTSIARSHNMTQIDVEDMLIRHHINQPAPLNHPDETPDTRYLEACRTISSAYSGIITPHTITNGIPNSIRETLLQVQHSTIMARILDIIAMTGWKSGHWFSMSQLIQLCQQKGMNRKSVMAVLTGDLSVINGEYVIYREYVEYPDIYGLNVSQGGRPTEFMYRVPSIEQLLKLLDVRWSPSDLITDEDVRTAHNYRLALHREYIRRVNPEVPMWWLAERLGVNVRTIQRFNRELDVQKMQNLACFTLEKSNLNTLPKRTQETSKNATNGFWLESHDGTRYPAWRHIGSYLLKTQDQEVKVVIQRPSKLSLNLNSEVQSQVHWQSITPEQFVKLQVFREHEKGQHTLKHVVDNLYQYVKQRVNRIRYDDMQLHFDSVVSYIAKDKVAETITAFLYAYDADGEIVKRPARRGIAYRMLKEFGNGNVYLSLLDSHTKMCFALARHALRFGYVPTAMKLLLYALN